MKLHDLRVCCWEQGNLPHYLCDANIIILYKNKGEMFDRSNYQGIIVLSVAGKVLAMILLNRLVATIAEKDLHESQCGFRTKRGMTGMVKKKKKKKEGTLCYFVGHTKAFESVSSTGLWFILKQLWSPHNFSQMVIQLHEISATRTDSMMTCRNSYPSPTTTSSSP